MKKRKLKSLLLNKQSISNLQKHQLFGGTGSNTIYSIMTGCSIAFIISVEIECPDEEPPIEDPDPGDDTTPPVTVSLVMCN